MSSPTIQFKAQRLEPTSCSVRVAADLIGVSERTIRNWIAAGLVSAERVGPRLIRVDLESLANMGRSIDSERGEIA